MNHLLVVTGLVLAAFACQGCTNERDKRIQDDKQASSDLRYFRLPVLDTAAGTEPSQYFCGLGQPSISDVSHADLPRLNKRGRGHEI